MKRTPATTPLDPLKVTKAHNDAGAQDDREYLVLVVDDSIDDLTMIRLASLAGLPLVSPGNLG